MRNEPLATLEIRHHHVIQMPARLAIIGNERERCAALLRPTGERRVVRLPDLPPTRLNSVAILELGGQEGRLHFRGQITRADVDPAVFIDLPPEEATAVGSFLPDDFSPLGERWIVNEQSATFAQLKFFVS